MLTRFGAVSLRGFWRDVLTFPTLDDGTLTDLTAAVLEMRVTPEDRLVSHDDYGWRRSGSGLCSCEALTAKTDGTGQGTISLPEPHAALFYFSSEVMWAQRPGVHRVSVTATVGPETAEIIRDTVVFY